jgi:hypothetical protein
VKTAFFASDPNLGRILAAVGYAGIDDLDQATIDLWLDDVHVAVKGGRNPAYREEDGQRVMKQQEITVRVGLGRGTPPTGVDLRLQPRVRDHQRRLPFMTEKFDTLIERAMQLLDRIEAVLPQPLSAPDWNAPSPGATASAPAAMACWSRCGTWPASAWTT